MICHKTLKLCGFILQNGFNPLVDFVGDGHVERLEILIDVQEPTSAYHIDAPKVSVSL